MVVGSWRVGAALVDRPSLAAAAPFPLGSYYRGVGGAAGTAAAAALRLRSNCRVMEVAPSTLVEVSWVTPEICPNWRSSGAATVEAMVSGLARVRVAESWIVSAW